MPAARPIQPDATADADPLRAPSCPRPPAVTVGARSRRRRSRSVPIVRSPSGRRSSPGGACSCRATRSAARPPIKPGTPGPRQAAFQPFWDAYHTITERYAGGEVDRKALIEGAIRGMIECPRRPVLVVPELRGVPPSLQGISGQFEGIGAEIATEAADGTQGCTTLGADCRLVVIAPIEGSPAEKAGLEPATSSSPSTASSLDGLTVDGAREGSAARRAPVVTLTIVPRRGRADRRSRSLATSSSRRRSSAAASPAGPSATSG